MKGVWRKRRELFKKSYHRGTLACGEAQDEVLVIEKSAQLGFEKIRIYGKSLYEMTDLDASVNQIITNYSSYWGAGVTGCMVTALPDYLSEREVTYTLSVSAELDSDTTIMLSNTDSFLFSDSKTLYSGGVASQVTVKGYPYFMISGSASVEELEGVLSSISLHVDAGTYQPCKITRAGDTGLSLELLGKNFLDASVPKYAGLAIVKEKNEDYITLESSGTHKTLGLALSIDGERLMNRKIRVSGNYEQSTSEVQSCITVYWLKSNGNSASNESVGAYGKINSTSGYISISKAIKNVPSVASKLSVILYSNINGKTEYSPSTISYSHVMVSLADSPSDYQEYIEPSVVSIPSEVNGVSLCFGSAGNTKDYLEIDKNAGTVKYYQLLGEKNEETGEEYQPILESPVITDLSEEDFAKELLALSLKYGHDGYLWARGAGGIYAEYYSLGQDKRHSLTVLYKNEEGEEIETRHIYHVREGSYYKIIPPHIEGYLPISQPISGIIKENCEISLIYRKES